MDTSSLMDPTTHNPPRQTQVAGRDIEDWLRSHPLLRDLLALREISWFNPAVQPAARALAGCGLGEADVDEAARRLQRFAPWVQRVFPETAPAHGLIESPLRRLPAMREALRARHGAPHHGELWVKLDSHLPISGSVKARGGIHEVMQHAESLALAAGLLRVDDDYALLSGPAARELFAAHRIAVASTGNLGLSIGIVGAALGFQVSVHMSADARDWKKRLLRERGVRVVEHASDYSAAVREGRREAAADARCHFVDDENSRQLFLGYAVAARRLRRQLDEAGVLVDAAHPLWVHLPCGVGGAPGGLAFGLKLAFGDAVHCLFAEPTHSPCMLLGVYTGLHDAVSVQDFGIDNRTIADGLAVGRASAFVGRTVQHLVEGYCTVSDEEMLALLALLERSEGLRLEPSALAGFAACTRLPESAPCATHLAWATGGGMVPEEQMQAYLEAAGEPRPRPASAR